MPIQTSNNVAVPRSFPIHPEDSSSNYVNLVLLSNILSPDYDLTTISIILNKCEVLDNTIVYVNQDKYLPTDSSHDKQLKKALFNLSSKNLKSFLEEEKKYGPIF